MLYHCHEGKNGEDLPPRFLQAYNTRLVVYIITSIVESQIILLIPPLERAKLLGRLANAFRKESGEITNIGIVPGAKCPLVRFDLKHMHYLACELSVDNRLGEYKADFIRYIIDADVSGIYHYVMASACTKCLDFRIDSQSHLCTQAMGGL